MSSAIGKSIRMFLVDGTPGGLRTAEIMNWTGQVTAAPRSDVAALVKRTEVSRTGIYLLLGDDDQRPGNTLAYIGESEDVAKRLLQHAGAKESGGKDFWDRAVVLTSKDSNFTKAHGKYLESRLISLAAEAGRARLANATGPPPVSLPEADRSDMEFFIEQAKIVLPILGVDVLRSTRADPADESRSVSDSVGPALEVSTREGVRARAQEIDGEFIVREGSRAPLEWTAPNHSYVGLYKRLADDGVLVVDIGGKTRVFSRDCVFASPSAAAAIVLGRAANGRKEWRVSGTRTTLAQWQESTLPAAAEPPEIN